MAAVVRDLNVAVESVDYRGLDDPGNPPEYEKEIHEAVPGSQYVKLAGVGHFPVTEKPEKVNKRLAVLPPEGIASRAFMTRFKIANSSWFGSTITGHTPCPSVRLGPARPRSTR